MKRAGFALGIGMLIIMQTGCNGDSQTSINNIKDNFVEIQSETVAYENVTYGDFQKSGGEEAVGDKNQILYRDILDLYVQAISEQWDADKYSENNLISAIVRPYWLGYTEDALNKEGFAFLDVNGDGIDELLLGWVGNEFWNMDDGYFFALYTIADKEIIMAVEGWERNRYVIGEDGYLYNSGSSGANDSCYLKYKFNMNYEDFLEPIEELYSKDSANSVWWEHVTNPKAIGKIEHTEKQEDLLIDEEEAYAIGEAWMKSGIEIDYTLFSEYKACE